MKTKTEPGALKAAREEILKLTEERDDALNRLKWSRVLKHEASLIVRELVRKELDIQNFALRSTAGREEGFVDGFDRALRIKELEDILITIFGCV